MVVFLFLSQSLKWPGFVEFDDVNGKVLTYSAQDKSPFSQQNLQGDAMDRDEETSRIQCNCF